MTGRAACVDVYWWGGGVGCNKGCGLLTGVGVWVCARQPNGLLAYRGFERSICRADLFALRSIIMCTQCTPLLLWPNARGRVRVHRRRVITSLHDINPSIKPSFCKYWLAGWVCVIGYAAVPSDPKPHADSREERSGHAKMQVSPRIASLQLNIRITSTCTRTGLCQRHLSLTAHAQQSIPAPWRAPPSTGTSYSPSPPSPTSSSPCKAPAERPR